MHSSSWFQPHHMIFHSHVWFLFLFTSQYHGTGYLEGWHLVFSLFFLKYRTPELAISMSSLKPFCDTDPYVFFHLSLIEVICEHLQLITNTSLLLTTIVLCYPFIICLNVY